MTLVGILGTCGDVDHPLWQEILVAAVDAAGGSWVCEHVGQGTIEAALCLDIFEESQPGSGGQQPTGTVECTRFADDICQRQ